MKYYISDMHFGQTSLLASGKYKERPFMTLDEMHTEMVNRWNKKVNNSDHVYILGDVGRRGYAEMHTELLSQLKGHKHLIVGNHDDVSDLRTRQIFEEICPYKKITDNFDGVNHNLVLCHFPIMMWEGQHRGTILLYGHVHNTKDEKLYQKYLENYRKERKVDCQAFNVGACLWNYEPVSLKEILSERDKRLAEQVQQPKSTDMDIEEDENYIWSTTHHLT